MGKTTLAKIITGDIARSSGSVDSSGLTHLFYCHSKKRVPDWSGMNRHLARVNPPSRHGELQELIAIFTIPTLVLSIEGRLYAEQLREKGGG